jgi:2-oxoglutarate dehydrogenase E1 component
LRRYPNAREIIWCQEEPQNQGAWYQIRHRLQDLAQPRTVYYAGRAAAAAPATGLAKLHEAEQRRLVDTALNAIAVEHTMRSTPRLTPTPGSVNAVSTPIRKQSS